MPTRRLCSWTIRRRGLLIAPTHHGTHRDYPIGNLTIHLAIYGTFAAPAISYNAGSNFPFLGESPFKLVIWAVSVFRGSPFAYCRNFKLRHDPLPPAVDKENKT